MLNLKISIFVLSLIIAGVVGGAGTTLVIHMAGLGTKATDCEQISHEKGLRQQHRGGVTINTGRDKGY
ncbi:hypothetical protein [Xenorhabdus bovienii]|uniref:Uncharacterized protein n=1 Tax=Xenorhabdus bovienii str. feltiae Moldova TaxID=1398200 RepID=A0A077NSD8_XENBV|nr:hypothetical protein [Xenorhabdus bovienii]CDH01448.1 conserved exported hypothetical protein [Xenorhabdus bovienii str. feltiae Moldova]